MFTIREMIEGILRHEGGYVDDPDDRGGATNYGITIGTYSKHIGKPATKEQIRDLDIAVAYEIYEKEYYLSPKINRLVQCIQPQVFDMCVNSGSRNAIKILQRVSNNLLTQGTPLVVDGIVGKQTTQACIYLNVILPDHVFNNALVDERMLFYARIVVNDSSQVKFLKGWFNRAESFKEKRHGTSNKEGEDTSR